MLTYEKMRQLIKILLIKTLVKWSNSILKNIKCKPGLTIKTLYYWLKQDNLEEFNKIIKSKSDFFDDSLINNKDIAQLYYNMNPDQFLFNNKLGWFVYNEFNILIES